MVAYCCLRVTIVWKKMKNVEMSRNLLAVREVSGKIVRENCLLLTSCSGLHQC